MGVPKPKAACVSRRAGGSGASLRLITAPPAAPGLPVTVGRPGNAANHVMGEGRGAAVGDAGNWVKREGGCVTMATGSAQATFPYAYRPRSNIRLALTIHSRIGVSSLSLRLFMHRYANSRLALQPNLLPQLWLGKTG